MLRNGSAISNSTNMSAQASVLSNGTPPPALPTPPEPIHRNSAQIGRKLVALAAVHMTDEKDSEIEAQASTAQPNLLGECTLLIAVLCRV